MVVEGLEGMTPAEFSSFVKEADWSLRRTHIAGMMTIDVEGSANVGNEDDMDNPHVRSSSARSCVDGGVQFAAGPAAPWRQAYGTGGDDTERRFDGTPSSVDAAGATSGASATTPRRQVPPRRRQFPPLPAAPMMMEMTGTAGYRAGGDARYAGCLDTSKGGRHRSGEKSRRPSTSVA